MYLKTCTLNTTGRIILLRSSYFEYKGVKEDTVCLHVPPSLSVSPFHNIMSSFTKQGMLIDSTKPAPTISSTQLSLIATVCTHYLPSPNVIKIPQQLFQFLPRPCRWITQPPIKCEESEVIFVPARTMRWLGACISRNITIVQGLIKCPIGCIRRDALFQFSQRRGDVGHEPMRESLPISTLRIAHDQGQAVRNWWWGRPPQRWRYVGPVSCIFDWAGTSVIEAWAGDFQCRISTATTRSRRITSTANIFTFHTL